MEHNDSQNLWTRAIEKAKTDHSPVARTPSQKLLKALHDGQDLSQWEPDLCVQMLKMPTIQNYSAIAKRLEKADQLVNNMHYTINVINKILMIKGTLGKVKY